MKRDPQPFEVLWRSYQATVLGGAGPVQVRECRRAFYAGAAAFSAAIAQPGPDPVRNVDRLSLMLDELAEFPRAVEEGRA